MLRLNIQIHYEGTQSALRILIKHDVLPLNHSFFTVNAAYRAWRSIVEIIFTITSEFWDPEVWVLEQIKVLAYLRSLTQWLHFPMKRQLWETKILGSMLICPVSWRLLAFNLCFKLFIGGALGVFAQVIDWFQVLLNWIVNALRLLGSMLTIFWSDLFLFTWTLSWLSITYRVVFTITRHWNRVI